MTLNELKDKYILTVNDTVDLRGDHTVVDRFDFTVGLSVY